MTIKPTLDKRLLVRMPQALFIDLQTTAHFRCTSINQEVLRRLMLEQWAFDPETDNVRTFANDPANSANPPIELNSRR